MTKGFENWKEGSCLLQCKPQTSIVMLRAGHCGAVDDGLRHRQLSQVEIEITFAPNGGE